ncbi:gigasin-2-like isoform X2 [Ostrea edulis]|uniref:gigasin-2-like isoform X2 n=1 Tax=Ostrea edulis TaxID=37623 RepID=UPI0020958D58|nr:gigasin-2-like isoform X2 [Ostrea edulis]XP_055996345.1 gigasin-2-like isoform X2 [Ostrea edulis]XP_055996346.1 gigasin-2-like isoform X2 [Ostrea edulis]
MPLFHILILCCLGTAAFAKYDCTNNGGYGCRQGGTCHFYGFCICPKGFQGHDCGLKTEFISTVNSTVECKNGGTCYQQDKCYCPHGFIGKLCEIPDTVARCAPDKMIVEAYRPLGFMGEVYLYKNRKSCALQKVPSDIPDLMKLERVVLHSDKTECSLTRLSDTPKLGDVTMKTTVVNTHNYNQFGPRDNIMDVSCVHTNSFEGKTREITETAFPFRMVALDMNGDPVQALAANESIILQFEPVGMADVRGVMVEYLEVYSINALSNEVVSKTIIENGCVLKAAQQHLEIPIRNYSEMSRDGKGWVARVSMRAFILLPGEPLLFKSRLRFCPGKCHGVTCAM